MRFAAGLRQSSPAPPPVKQSRVDTISPSRQGRPYAVNWDFDRAVREGYDRVVWVMRCVNAIADSWAGLPIVQRQGDREKGAVIENPHDSVALLNAFPNDYEEAELFKQALSVQFLLSKAGAFVEYLRARDGDLFAFHLLPPGRTKPIPGTGGRFVNGFEIDMGQGRKRVLPPVADDEPHGVLWIRTRHPADPFSSYTPLEAAGLAVETDWMARLYSRNFMRNDARPPMIVAVKGGITPEDEAALRARLAPGPDSAGKFAIIETTVVDEQGQVVGPGGGIDVEDLGAKPRDAEWVNLRELSKDEILAAFDCPESVVLGKSADRTFDNAGQERINFKLDTCRQHARRVLTPFDRLDPAEVRFLGVDWSSDPDIQAALMAQKKFALDEVKGLGRTPNEYREEFDVGEPVAGGDAIWGPIIQAPLMGDGASAGKAVNGRTTKAVVAFGPYELDADWLARQKDSTDRRFTSWERHVTTLVRGFFGRQERVVLRLMRSASRLRGTRHWEGPSKGDHAGLGDKGIDPSQVFDRDTWDAELSDLAEAWTVSIFEDFGTEVIRRVSDERSASNGGAKQDDAFDTADPRVTEALAARRNRIRAINDTTWHAIRDEIVAGEQAGETIETIANRVRRVFELASQSRAATIARTEVISAANEGSLLGARQSGVVDTKIWLSIGDDRTRESHGFADGQTVGIEEPYLVGGAEMMFPGDPAGPSEEVVNCRCSQLFGVGGQVL